MTKKEFSEKMKDAVEFMIDDLYSQYTTFLSECRDDDEKEFYSDIEMWIQYLLDTANI